MGFPFRYGINSMLLNNRGQGFLDSEFILGIEPRRDNRTHTFWFSLDCTEARGGQAADACAGHTSGKVSVMGTLSSRSSVIFDLDNDGDLDIVTNDYNSEPTGSDQQLGPGKADSLAASRATRNPIQSQWTRSHSPCESRKPDFYEVQRR
jgi:hypothetical protein